MPTHATINIISAACVAGMSAIGGLAGIGWADLEANDAGIIIHTLEYLPEANAILQDRTVTAVDRLVAHWAAEVRSSALDDPVCFGGGAWKYAAGRRQPQIPLDEWVGDKECTERLKPGITYQACAAYEWGDGSYTENCSLGFRIGG